MTEPGAGEPVCHAVTVPLPIDRAFSVFVDAFPTWWPREYTWSQELLETIGIETRVGGRCYERGPHGFQADWGRILAWEPPRRIVLSWQVDPQRAPQPDPAKASEVEVRFIPEGPSSTRVALEHRHFDRHGPGSAAYRAAMASPRGWPLILGRYAATAV